MKYKVIGWTWYDNSEIPFSNNTIGFAERNAIIDEIKKHKYLFSGWHHQEEWNNCVPILNDGKKRGFSQRGWGGLMAEAYGEMGDYDYISYTYSESIRTNYLKFPKKEFDVEDFVSSPLENEHFNIEVKKELFDIAKTSNPFYLEDTKDLRSIDTNDTITLLHNNESLTFLVADVNRNKKEIDFDKHHLINSKYKVIVTHKQIKKVYIRTPMLILWSNCNKLFKKCLKEYNFNTLFELINTYSLDILAKNISKEQVIPILKKFINEYINYSFNSLIINHVLKYINDESFSNEILDQIKTHQ